MKSLLLANNVVIDIDATAQQTQRDLLAIARSNGYLYQPMEILDGCGDLVVATFKILVGRSMFWLTWHDDTLIFVKYCIYNYDRGGYDAYTVLWER